MLQTCHVNTTTIARGISTTDTRGFCRLFVTLKYSQALILYIYNLFVCLFSLQHAWSVGIGILCTLWRVWREICADVGWPPSSGCYCGIKTGLWAIYPRLCLHQPLYAVKVSKFGKKSYAISKYKSETLCYCQSLVTAFSVLKILIFPTFPLPLCVLT